MLSSIKETNFQNYYTRGEAALVPFLRSVFLPVLGNTYGAHRLTSSRTLHLSTHDHYQVKSNEQADRVEIYEKTVEVLGPEADKLKALFMFQKEAIMRFASEVKKLSNPEVLKGFISQTTKVTMGKMINMFMMLDALKNMKACLNNDYSFWKRANGYLQQQTGGAVMDPEKLMETGEIQRFLATQDSITTQLQQELNKIEGYDQVLAEVVNESAVLFDRKFYVLPNEKHQLLKVMAYGLYLIDGGRGDPKTKKAVPPLNKSKYVDVKRFEAIFRQLPVVPLFGDMHVTLVDYLKKCPAFDEKTWFSSSALDDAKVDKDQYNIEKQLEGFKGERDQLICALRLADGVDADGCGCNLSGMRMSDLALRGIKTLSNWTSAISELYAWKLAHPTDKFRNRECTDDKEPYEKAARYNYTTQEKTAIIEIIAMIKDVSRTLRQMQIPLGQAVRRDMHQEIQHFVQLTIRDAIRKTTKKKKVKARTVLMAIRNTCADWLGDREPDDPAIKGEKETNYQPQSLPSRSVGAGSTQLFMLRTMLESLCIDPKKNSLVGDIDKDHLPEMRAFYERSSHFATLLDFNQSIQQSSDLSQLWYREFYLELTQGQKIQFPIEMSMPFILVDHILHSRDPAMIEYVLYPLDLYNDAANFALTSFKKQYLYDEVEAEVDLAFDQFVFRLSEEIYTHYKARASTIMLSSRFKSECARVNYVIEEMSEHRYSTVLAQTSFQLLGRSVDISRLLAQRLNVSIKKSLDHAISRFEARSLSHIHELENMMENNRVCHTLLRETLQLDPFDDILAEVNNAINHPVLSRTTVHVFAEMCTDLIPNMTFNSGSHRFIRPSMVPMFGTGVPERERMPGDKMMHMFGSKSLNTVFAAIHRQTDSYIGRSHFDCVARLLGYGSVSFIIDEMLKTVATAIKKTLAPYVTSLVAGMPKACKLPLYEYGSDGAIGFYQLTLKDIMIYPDLQTEVFHAFREIGNSVVAFLMLEESITKEEVLDLAQAMPFQGVVPPAYKEGDDLEAKIREAREGVAYMNFSEQIQKISDGQRRELGKKAAVLTAERMCKGLSMFTAVLGRIKVCLEEADAEAEAETGRPVFNGPTPINEVMDVDECNQFHRLWSAILYISSSAGALGSSNAAPGSPVPDRHQEYFGDGLQWAGCTIIALTGQRRRYETFDFCYHILNAWEVDKKNTTQGGIRVQDFVKLAHKKKALNTQIFTVLDKFMEAPQFTEKVEYFSPPSLEPESDTAV